MVPGGQGYILRSGRLCRRGKLFSPPFLWTEGSSQRLIGFMGDFQTGFGPLALAQYTVNSKMDKHSKAHFLKILNIRFDNHGAIPFFGNSRIDSVSFYQVLLQKARYSFTSLAMNRCKQCENRKCSICYFADFLL